MTSFVFRPPEIVWALLSEISWSERRSIPNWKRRFVLEYLATNLQGAEAARRAGYSPRAARVQASQLLSDPNISRAVQEGYRVVMEEASARSQSVVLDWNDVVKRDSEIATFDPASVLDWDEGSMRIRPMSMVPPSARQCISSIRETRDSLAVTFVNPHPSLDRLTRHHTVLGGARPVEADAKGQQETDYEKAQIAADWLEGISAGLGTSNVGDIVTALRKPHTTSLSRPSSIVPPEGC